MRKGVNDNVKDIMLAILEQKAFRFVRHHMTSKD